MAKIIANNKEIQVKDGDSITKTCKELGVPFSCYSGDCQVCKIEILEGADNLSGLTNKEKDSGMDKNNRLACQCKIKSGEVKIKF